MLGESLIHSIIAQARYKATKESSYYDPEVKMTINNSEFDFIKFEEELTTLFKEYL